MKEGKRYLLYKQEVYSIRVSLHFVGENVLCFDVACPEVETLFILLYYIPNFQMDQPKYIFKKAMPTQKLAKWEMLLS